MAHAPSQPRPAEPGRPALERQLGPIAVSLSGIGIILGAGIYVLVGEAAGEAGNGVWLAFVIGALVAAPTGMAFAELASMFPDAGAAASYTREAFGVRTAFLTGWFDLAVSVIGAAAVALGFGGYLDDVVELGATPLAIAVLIASATIAYIGVRETTSVAIAFTLAEAGGLVLVIFVGLPNVGDADLFSLEQGWVGVLGAGSLVYFAYQGFEQIATLSEETVNPRRNIPIAIVIAVIVTTILYVLVTIASISSIPWQQLADSDAPLADVVEAVAGDRWADVITAIALFATFNTVLLLVATGARISYGMARRRLLPSMFARVSRTRHTPWISTLIIAVLAVALASTGDIGFVAQVTNFAVFALFAIVNAAVIMLRRSRPDAERPFRLPGDINGIPTFAVLGLLGNLALAGFMDLEAFIAGLALLAVGLVASEYIVRYERRGGS